MLSRTAAAERPAGPEVRKRDPAPAGSRTGRRRTPDRWWPVAELLPLLLGAGLATLRFSRIHRALAPRAAPDLPAIWRQMAGEALSGPVGWWRWWDQGWYSRSAVAWAHGVTDPHLHWYLPGYPLLGAPFVLLTRNDPFIVPDLACLLAALVLSARLARRLIDAGRWSTALGCVSFLLTVVLPDTTMRAWVTPWSTTPEAVGFLGALLATVGLPGSERFRWRAALAGMAAGAVVGFRPADGMLLLAVVAASMPALRPRRDWFAVLLAAGAGAALPLAVLGGAYVAVWGLHPSPYVIWSGRIGFEFRLLPLRWVELMVDPHAIYPRGRGLAEGFVWVAPGIAGLVAAVAAPGRCGRVPHLVVGGAVVADLLLFLCYRDLHPDGMWLFGLHHYFKALLPLFALYATRLAVQAARVLVFGAVGRPREAGGVLAGMLAVGALLPWHVELKPWKALRWGAGNSVVLPEGLQPIEGVAMLPGRSTSPSSLIISEGRTVDGRALMMGADLAIPDPGGSFPVLPLLPLRHLPAVRTEVAISSPVLLDRSRQPVLFKQVIRWGLPSGWSTRLGPLSY